MPGVRPSAVTAGKQLQKEENVLSKSHSPRLLIKAAPARSWVRHTRNTHQKYLVLLYPAFRVLICIRVAWLVGQAHRIKVRVCTLPRISVFPVSHILQFFFPGSGKIRVTFLEGTLVLIPRRRFGGDPVSFNPKPKPGPGPGRGREFAKALSGITGSVRP